MKTPRTEPPKTKKCLRCGHIWTPRTKGDRPVICPHCKSPYWNISPRSSKPAKGGTFIREGDPGWESQGFNNDFAKLIKIFNKLGVEYCITGAHAVAFYAEPRFTEDIDFYVFRSKANSQKVAMAVKEFLGQDGNIDGDLFTGEKVMIRMGVAPNKIELSNYLSGLDDSDIKRHRIKGAFGDIDAYYIGLNDLIKNKGAVRNLPHRGNKHKQDERDYYMLKKAEDERR